MKGRLLLSLMMLAGGALAWLLIPERLLLPDEDQSSYQPRQRLFVESHQSRPAEFVLPADSGRVELQVLAAVSLKLPYEPDDRYPLAFDVAFLQEGKKQHGRTVEFNSRISIQDDPFSRRSLRGARLVAGAWDLTDDRLFVLQVPRALVRGGGTLQVRARAGTQEFLLVRAFAHRDDLMDVEQLASLAPATAERRKRLAGIGTGLSEWDVPASLWQHAVGRQIRRLAPTGKRGYDYDTRRVLLSRYRRPFRDTLSDEAGGISCGPQRWSALNLSGPVRIRILGPPKTRVVMGELMKEDRTGSAFDQTTETRLDDAGDSPLLTLNSNETDDRSLVISCPEERVTLRVFTDRAGLAARLGEIRPGMEEGALEKGPSGYPLVPDFRRVRFVDLARDQLARFVAKQAAVARVELRSQVEEATDSAPVDAEISVMRDGVRLSRERLAVDRVTSKFERLVNGELLTEPAIAEVEIPAGAELQISGSPRTLARISFEQRGVEEQLALDYRTTGHGKRWRYAPRDLDRWADVEPEDITLWNARDAFFTVVEQVRLIDPRPLRAFWIAGGPQSGQQEAESVAERLNAGPQVSERLRDSAVLEDPPTLVADAGTSDRAPLTASPVPGTERVVPETAAPAQQPDTVAESPETTRDRFRPGPRSTRVLAPLGSPISQRVFVERELAPGPAPGYALTELAGPRDVWLLPSARRHRLLLRPDPAVLGQPLQIFVGGVLRQTTRVRTTAAYHPFPLPSGVHRIEVRGLGAAGMAYSSGLPVSGAATLQRRYHQLTPDAPLRYRFDVQAEERQVLLLQVLSSERTSQCYRFMAEIERIHPELPRRATMERQGCTFHAEQVLFWDLGARGATLSSQERFPLARVRDEGLREVEVQLLPPQGVRLNDPGAAGSDAATEPARELYLRALLIGDGAREATGSELRLRRQRE